MVLKIVRQVVISCLGCFNFQFRFYARILFAHLVCKVVKVDELNVCQTTKFSTGSVGLLGVEGQNKCVGLMWASRTNITHITK